MKSALNDLVVVVRQRVTGSNNGSSTYLLAICRHLRSRGRRVTMIWPNPATFGRWPVLLLSPDMDFLDNTYWRGGFRVGRIVFALNPAVYVRAMMSLIEAVLLRAAVISKPFVEPSVSSLAAPVVDADLEFLERKALGANGILLDYAFCVPYLEALPKVRSAVLMHDLFSSRPGQFAGTTVKDDYGFLTRADEMKLLGTAGAVIAIQNEEAAVVLGEMPQAKVLVCPMAVEPGQVSKAGINDSVLFVGSAAAPNVLGLEWFFELVWPLALDLHPGLHLKVAGSVGRRLKKVPDNVEILGVVPDLVPLYDQAAVVISPLTTGSGLKIKLIEAMAEGKAIVATRLTLQGVADEVGAAVVVADDPSEFARSLVDLVRDRARRDRLGSEALVRVAESFSPAACFAPIEEYFAISPE